MNLSVLIDPLFRLPFLTGLTFALVLPVLGMYLRLREEWLAALAFAQVAAAGSLASSILGLPPQAGALACTCGAAALKGWIARAGNNGYALLMIVGWAAAILMLANVPIAEQLGHALFDGQLYFTNIGHLAIAALFLGITATLLPWLSRRLLLERMFPDFFRASGLSARRYHLIFDLLIAAGLALATSCIGVMAAFGLVFVPSMIAYRIGPNWKASVGIAAGSSLGAYLIAFAAALLLDQPFGPVLVVTLAALAVFGWLALSAL
ncbi:MAG TPA: metal ABC transporter permease, partial [Anaerolineales bacterium]|nr:metal ABC transporter permease [Anaerolineales bacterium]